MKYPRIALLCVALTLFLSGCSVGTPSVDEIVEQLGSAQEQRMHGVMEASFTDPQGQAQTMVSEQWQDGTTRMRLEYQDGPDQIKGSLMIRNGQQFWMYDPAKNTYTETTLPEDLANSSAEDMNAQLRQMVEQMLATMNLEYQGSEEIAGRTAYKLHATPRPEASDAPLAMINEATLWVDSETWQILKQEADFGQYGGMTMQYRTIDYNPQLSADLFTFTPPPGAQKLDAPPMPATQ